jgi:ABC-2 type transport system permease protein
MSRATFLSTAAFVAWRSLRLTFRNPVLILPALMMPFFLLVAFTGALSSLGETQDLGDSNYTAFQFIFALMQAATFIGAMGGIALVEDFESGFAGRLMLAAPRRTAILAGNVAATVVRGLAVFALLTGGAYLIGMETGAGVLDFVGLFGLAGILMLGSALWSAGMAMHMRSTSAGNLITLPLFLLLFLTPVFVPLAAVTGWLHAVAKVNPFTYLLESGRGFIRGEPVYTLWAYTVVVVMVILFGIFAIWGVRRAEAAGAEARG